MNWFIYTLFSIMDTDPYSSEWGKFVCETNTCEKFESNLVRLLNDHFHNPQLFHCVVNLFLQNCTLMHPELDFQAAFLNFREYCLQVAQQITRIVNDLNQISSEQVEKKRKKKKKKLNRRERRRRREILRQDKGGSHILSDKSSEKF